MSFFAHTDIIMKRIAAMALSGKFSVQIPLPSMSLGEYVDALRGFLKMSELTMTALLQVTLRVLLLVQISYLHQC